MSRRIWRFGLVPMMLFYIVFFLFPQTSFLAISGFATDGPGQMGGFIGAANYKSIFADSFFMRAIVNTLELGAATAVGSVILAFPIAYAIAQMPAVGKYLFVLIIATMFSSAVALALGWQTLLSPNGGLNGVLLALHLISAPLPLSSNFTSVVIGTIHGSIPVAALGLLPTCEAVSRRQIEAAVGLGASHWMIFKAVIVPQTYRAVLSMGLIVFAITSSAFTTPALLGGGKVALLSLAIREQLLTIFDYPKAATLAAVLIVITLAVILLTRALVRRREGGTSPLGNAR
jgi:putative spermidine/putrescine transport system permease protein